MSLLLVILLSGLIIASIGIHLYGIILCFKKSLSFGLVGLFIPAIALTIGTAKVLKVDLS
jgi:hypothetical protein